jgi:outer membrane protein
MKRVAVAVAILFAAGILCATASYAKEVRLAYVDLAKVFEEYKKTKDAEKTMEEKGKVKEAERKKMIDELRKLKDEQALLSEKAKAEKQKDIDAKIKILQDFDMKTRDELLKERNDTLGVLLKEIEAVVNAMAKDKGYDMVLNSRTLLYGAPEYDLTAEAIKSLNK